MMIKKQGPIFNLDEEEQALSDSVDRGEWKSVQNLKERISFAKEAARNYFREKEKVSIRVQSADMDIVRRMAAEKGLRPQIYLASIVHKLAAGHIED